ncbi:MAG: MFS transporter [Ruminococcaceae bacterium]|jgi:MFS family permease|nr:MFS transporter [Oscillospiraceae bacterium]
MNSRKITAFSLIGYFFIGAVPITLAPSLPYLIRDFNLSLALAGTVFVARSAGTFLGVAAGGYLSDRLGRKPLMILGCLLQGVFLALVGLSPDFLIITLLFGLIGFATGLVNPVFNALVAEVNQHRRAAALNALHGVYSVGAMLGPIAAGLLLASRFGWRAIFFGGSLLWTVYGLSLFLVAIPRATRPKKQDRDSTIASAGKHVKVLLLLLVLVSYLYNCTATSLVNWINTYLDQVEFPVLLGAGMVSIFYLGLAIGRFACGLLAEKTGYARLILYCALGSLAFYPLAIYTTAPLLIAFGVFASGLCFSGLHPTSMAWANRLFPEKGGTIASMMSIVMTLGAMSVPWLVGYAADRIGFRLSFSLNIALLVVLVFVASSLLAKEKVTA